MSAKTFPDISRLELDELLELRAAVDARLQEKRHALLEEAERLEDVLGNGVKKRRSRNQKTTSEVQGPDNPTA